MSEKEYHPSIHDVPIIMPQPMEAPARHEKHVPITEEDIDGAQADIEEVVRRSIVPEKIDPNDPKHWN